MEILDFKTIEGRRRVLGPKLNAYSSADDYLDVADSGSKRHRSIQLCCEMRINVLKHILDVFQRALTSLLLSGTD